MKKKFTLYLMTLSILLSVLPVVNAAETYDDTYEPYIRSINFLNGIGAANIDTVNYDGEVTRAEAAYYVSGIMGDIINYTDIKGVFTDVSHDTKYAKEIEALARLGIIHGFNDGSFRPEETATVVDIASMMIYALGMEYEADAKGGGSSAYISVAAENELLDGIRAGDEFVTIGDLSLILYNTLHSEIAECDMTTPSYVYSKTDETLLHRNFDIVYDEGVIVKNDITALWASTDIGEGMIELETNNGNIVIDASDTDTWKDIGKRVRVYYNGETDDLKYVYHEIHKKNSAFNVSLKDLDFNNTDFSGGKLSYIEKGAARTKEKKIEKDFSLIYNNMYYAEGEIEVNDFKGCAGDITLIDNDGNNTYDVVSLKVYDTLYVDSVSTVDELIFDRYDEKLSVSTNESEYDKIVIKDSSGKVAKFSDIDAGNVISVAKSSPGTNDKAIEIIISNEYITGKITSVENGDFTTAVIDDINEYTVLKKAADDLFVGETVTGYTDAFGNIAYIDSLPGRDWSYGICIKNILNDDGTFSLRLITANGTVEEYKAAQKIQVDDVKYTDTVKLKNTLDKVTPLNINVETKGAYVMRYRLNEGGEVREIDTVNKGEEKTENNLTLVGSGTFVKCSGNVLGWTIPYNPDARVITITDASGYTDADKFKEANAVSVGVASSVIRYVGRKYSVAAYKSGSEELKADFIVQYGSMEYSWDNQFFVIDNVSEEYNTDVGEVMMCVNGFQMGVEKKYWIGDSHKEEFKSKNFIAGDVIRCIVDGNNRIIKEETISKFNGDGTVQISKATGENNVVSGELTVEKNASITIQNGFVHSMEDGVMLTTCSAFGNSGATSEGLDWTSERLYYTEIPNSAVITVVDTSRRKDNIYLGSKDDIKDYVHQGDKCSRVLMRWRSNNLYEVVVYNQ